MTVVCACEDVRLPVVGLPEVNAVGLCVDLLPEEFMISVAVKVSSCVCDVSGRVPVCGSSVDGELLFSNCGSDVTTGICILVFQAWVVVDVSAAVLGVVVSAVTVRRPVLQSAVVAPAILRQCCINTAQNKHVSRCVY